MVTPNARFLLLFFAYFAQCWRPRLFQNSLPRVIDEGRQSLILTTFKVGSSSGVSVGWSMKRVRLARLHDDFRQAIVQPRQRSSSIRPDPDSATELIGLAAELEEHEPERPRDDRACRPC